MAPSLRVRLLLPSTGATLAGASRASAFTSSAPALSPTSEPSKKEVAVAAVVPETASVAVTVSSKTSSSWTEMLLSPTVSLASTLASRRPARTVRSPITVSVSTSSRPSIMSAMEMSLPSIRTEWLPVVVPRPTPVATKRRMSSSPEYPSSESPSPRSFT